MKTFPSSRPTSIRSAPLNSRWTRGLLFSGAIMLSTGCGGVENAPGPEGLSGAERHSQALTGYPSTCAGIRAVNPIAADGDYVLYVNGDATRGWLAWCQDMASSPTEYLTLANLGSQANYSEYLAGGSVPGTTVRSTYRRLRINPSTLVVNTGDERFAISTGSLTHGSTTVTSMPFATAMACNPSGNQGHASIDLRGTPFTLTGTPFVPGGAGASGFTNYANANQTATLQGGGNCGWESLPGATNPFNQNGGSLQLQYLGTRPMPATCADLRTSLPTAGDWAYLLYVAGDYRRPWAAWCQDMASTPSEYLALPGTNGQANFSEYLAGGSSPGTTVRSTYTRLRIDPATLVVNTGDERFATSTGALSHSGTTPVRSMPFATGMACINDGSQGRASIDLRGTPFNLHAASFSDGGYNSMANVDFGNDAQTVDMRGGGFCGWASLPDATSPFNQNGGSLPLTYVSVP